MEVYAKNCFDRFGDDLTELILQYLTFEDKVRLECVSKQWRRLVFNKQFAIELSMFETPMFDQQTKDSLRILHRKRTNLISILKKCLNIKTVRINEEVYSFVLLLIGQYCDRIKSLTYYSDICGEKNLMKFFLMYGHKLEELDIDENCGQNNREIKQILEFCPNVKNINILNIFKDIKTYFYNDINILPKLVDFKSPLKISSQDLELFKRLSDNYRQTMKTLDLSLDYMTEEELKTCIECIARFENLKELKLSFHYLKTNKPIDDCLSLIGQKCNKLLKLDLDINMSVRRYYITHGLKREVSFFTALSEFKALKSLTISLPKYTKVMHNVKCFKHCKQLKHLDISCPELTEDFFANIASFVPKLQSLRIEADKQFSDSFIDSFYLMKNIQRVELIFKDSAAKSMIWYFGKSLSEVMLSPDRMYVNTINDNCGLIVDMGFIDSDSDSD